VRFRCILRDSFIAGDREIGTALGGKEGPWPTTQLSSTSIAEWQHRNRPISAAARSASWAEAAAKAQYLIELFAATPEARNPRRQALIAKVLDEFARLSGLSESETTT